MISANEFSTSRLEICRGMSGEYPPVEVASLISVLNALISRAKVFESRNCGNTVRVFVAFRCMKGKSTDEAVFAERGSVAPVTVMFASSSV